MKITLRLDVNKIPKEKIQTRSYTNKNGEIINQKYIDIDIVYLKQKQSIKSFGDSILTKVAFACIPQSKQEREANVKQIFVGDCTSFIKNEETGYSDDYDTPMSGNEITLDQIPF